MEFLETRSAFVMPHDSLECGVCRMMYIFSIVIPSTKGYKHDTVLCLCRDMLLNGGTIVIPTLQEPHDGFLPFVGRAAWKDTPRLPK